MGVPPLLTELRRWLLFLGGTAVGAALVGAVWSITAAAAASPGTFTLHGTMTLMKAVGAPSVGCLDTGGYSDINEGASVTVYDASGKVAAVGRLGKGIYASFVCTFPIDVANVPDGQQFYQVEVTHRGKVSVTADQAKAGKVSLSLGSG